MLPDIPYARFRESGKNLHMWTQMVGKFRLAQTPWINHSWHATFYVNACGLTTALIPGKNRGFEVAFDFLQHRLRVQSTDGEEACFPLQAMSVADFYRRFLDALKEVGAPSAIHHTPNEVPDPAPFAEQTDDGAYDPQAVRDFWRALIFADSMFKQFRTGFIGKVSPVHFFWGSFDLAVTRFSGRKAPLHPGGIPALPDAITREAYSHEVSSAGFWPGGGGVDEAAFYSYAYPTPDGFKEAPVSPDEAYFHDGLGEFVLPYEAVRRAENPSAALLAFLSSTYKAAAEAAGWDRAALECDIGEPRKPREV